MQDPIARPKRGGVDITSRAAAELVLIGATVDDALDRAEKFLDERCSATSGGCASCTATAPAGCATRCGRSSASIRWWRRSRPRPTTRAARRDDRGAQGLTAGMNGNCGTIDRQCKSGIGNVWPCAIANYPLHYRSRMALFPNFLDDLKAQTDIVAVIGDVMPLKKTGSDVEGPVSVPSGEDAVVQRQPGQGVLQVLRLRRRRRRRQVRRAAAEGLVSRGRAVPGAAGRHGGSRDRRAGRRIGRRRPSARHWSSCTRGARRSFRSSCRRPAGAGRGGNSRARALRHETMATFGYGYAPAAGRETLHGRFADREGARRRFS